MGVADNEEASSRKKKVKEHLLSVPSISSVPVLHESEERMVASHEPFEHADMAVANFMYEAGIPLSASKSYFFQKMGDAISYAGPGYKMPSYDYLRGKLLERSVQNAHKRLDEIRKSWKVTGCSIMVDRWSIRADYVAINFFVYCSKGTVFLKSVELTETTESFEELLKLFDNIVQEVGPTNVVNFVTDTTPNYKAAGKAIMEKYGTFYWSACSAHCIELMLKEIGEMEGVKEVLTKAKKITQLIYNNEWVLDLMRKMTSEDIVHPATTRFSSSFLTLKRIIIHKSSLRNIFRSPSWTKSTLSKQKCGLEVAELVEDHLLWSLCENIIKVTEPLCSVLHLLESEGRPSIGYIYDAMEKAKKNIKKAFSKEFEYLPFLKIIDRIWKEELHNPLHAAGYYLNPSMLYGPSFSSNKMIQKGLLDCIETLVPDVNSQILITSHFHFYKDGDGDFGRPVAVQGRDSVAPATWWSLYGADYPDLQQFAIRVLSQTCSLIQCDRTRTMFDHNRPKKPNRLERRQIDDLIFVRHNLHIIERKEACKSNTVKHQLDSSSLDANDVNVQEWVEDPQTNDG